MNFKCKKTNDCFENASTYEYMTEVKNNEILPELSSLGSCRTETKFRKPFFFIDMHDGTKLKGVLDSTVFKASFFGDTDGRKTDFEAFLESI